MIAVALIISSIIAMELIANVAVVRAKPGGAMIIQKGGVNKATLPLLQKE